MEIKNLFIKDLALNNGQIDGLPKNPRFIKDYRFEALKKSIEDAPEMLSLRELIVFPYQDKFVIIAGNMRYRACKELGYKELPCKVLNADTSVAKLREYTIKDNQAFGADDWDMLANEWDEKELIGWGMELPTDWGNDEENEDGDANVVEDEIPEDVETRCKKGDIWQLGRHRLMCGDSTKAEDVALLMNGAKADLVFTDPPYGMKKEKDGVLNDNLNFDNLLEFNKKWIPLSFEHTKENGSWYCWGIDEPLMDIYSNILKPMQKNKEIAFRNLITWDKGNGQGQLSEDFRMYPIADEKCLFVMVGGESVQGFCVNQDDYSESMDKVRLYLEKEIAKLNQSDKHIANALGYKDGRTVNHWRSKSQFALPTEENYNALREYGRKVLGDNVFLKKDYVFLKKDYEELKKDYEELKKDFYEGRAYFDNTHDNMNNVWHFDRTSAQERELTGGHATPKPIALCTRAIKSSSRENEIVLDLFGGSGSTLIACEQLNRTCYMCELDAHYCDVILTRWEKLTGQTATKI